VDSADYFLGVRRYFFEINDSTSKVFNLEVNDLIGVKPHDGRPDSLQSFFSWDFLKLTRYHWARLYS
jgi:hypothetical protein